MNFDLVIFTSAKGIDTSCARNVTRLACYEAFARAMHGRGKVLVVPHYLSIIPEVFSEPREIISRILKPTVRQLADNLYVYSPVVPAKLGMIADLLLLLEVLRWHLGRQVKAILRRIGAKGPWRVISVEDPFHHVLLDLVDESVKTYDCLDEYALYGGAKKENPSTLAHERKLAQRVDVIFTTAKILYGKLRQYNYNTFYSPNAVDFELFHKSTLDTTPIAPDLEEISRPVVGFIGSLNWWFDFGLLQEVISRRPDWSFVFVGEVADCYPNVRQGVVPIKRMGNAHFLGWQQMQDLPSFLKGFDVAILPYNQDRAAQSVNSNKMYQYMAAGVPVVSTPIPEAQQYSEVIEIARGADGFTRAIQECLSGDNKDRISRQVAIAREQTWNNRAQQRLAIMEDYLERKVSGKTTS